MNSALATPGTRFWTRWIAVISLLLLGALGAVADDTGRSATVPQAVTPTAPAAIPAFRQARNLAVLTIQGPIDGVTAHSIKKRLKQSIDGGADAIVIDLDTPGGEVGAVLEICSELRRCGKHTIAWIHPTAYSGGAIIALACREIVVAPGSTMGDAAPIVIDPIGFKFFQGLSKTERAKMLSPLLIEIVDSARANGYDEHLVCGFVTLGVELWLVEEKQTGKRYCLTESEYRALFDREPPRDNPVVPSLGDASRAEDPGSAEEQTEANQPLVASDDHSRAYRGTVKDLTNEAVNELNDPVAGLQEKSRRPNFAKADPGRFRDLGYVMDGKTLLTIKEQQIKDFGLASTTIKDDAELQQFTGAQNLRRLDQSWSETLVGFMTQGMSGLVVRGLLIVVFLMSMFLELSIPGATIPGLVAVLALAGLIVPPMLIGAASWWALAAILLGVVLLLLEVFVIPGFGVAGIAGLLLLFGGLVGTFADAGELFPGSGKGGGDLAWAMSIVLLAIFVAGVGMFLFSKYTHSFPIAGRMVLASARPQDDGEGLLAAMAPQAPSEGPVRLGEIGTASTPLRPSGTAEFGEKLVDVVSEFGFVDVGHKIRVTSVSQFRVGVEAVKDVSGGPGGPGGTA